MKTRIVGEGFTNATDVRQLARAWDKLYIDAAETLKKRMEEHQIPHPGTRPMQDLCLVYRIPNEYKGNLVLPEEYADGHDAPFQVGILLRAGPEAFDILESHGALPGDFIHFARFAGEEEVVQRVRDATAKYMQEGYSPNTVADKVSKMAIEERAKKKLMRIQARLIHQSVDLDGRMSGDKPVMEMIREVNAKTGNVVHVIEPVVENIL